MAEDSTEIGSPTSQADVLVTGLAASATLLQVIFHKKQKEGPKCSQCSKNIKHQDTLKKIARCPDQLPTSLHYILATWNFPGI